MFQVFAAAAIHRDSFISSLPKGLWAISKLSSCTCKGEISSIQSSALKQHCPGCRLGHGQAVVPYHMSRRSSYFCFCSSWVLIIQGEISCPALVTAGFGSWASRLVCCWYNAAAELSILSMIAALLPVTLLKRALFVLLSCGCNKWPTFHSEELLHGCTIRETHAPRAVLSSRKGLLLQTLQESIGRKVWVLLAASYPPAVHGALVLVLAEHGDQVVRLPQNKLQPVTAELWSTWSDKQDLTGRHESLAGCWLRVPRCLIPCAPNPLLATVPHVVEKPWAWWCGCLIFLLRVASNSGISCGNSSSSRCSFLSCSINLRHSIK